MSILKKNIVEALKKVSLPNSNKNIVDAGFLKNILVFGNEIVVDVISTSPAMNIRKKLESDITIAIQKEVSKQAEIKINTEIKTLEKPNTIQAPKIENIKNIVAIASGKGGVGKSTVASNLAVALAIQGFKVGLIDADIYGPSSHIMFDVKNEKPRSTNIDDKSKMLPVENYGVKLLSLGFFTSENQAIVWRGPMATKALQQMIHDTHWGELDFLLIDLPPGTGDIHLSILQTVPVTGVVIVSTPQSIALADAKKGVDMFHKDTINVPIIGIIENMSYFTPKELPDNKYYIFGKDGAKNLSQDLDIPLLGEVPLIQSIREAGDIGRPAVLQENTPTAIKFMNITKNMVEQLNIRNEKIAPTKVVEITHMNGCSTK